ncbi:MAG: ABC transporter permease subunit [Verrucomicrobia bacterium]|nr:ABC transporter permease subunit [Verrucomicrobiota bacterium]
MNAFLNQRTYDTVEDLLGVSLRYFDANSGQLYEQAREQALTARAHLRTLNPERLTWYAPIVTILLLSMIAYLIAGSGIVIFTVIGFLLIIGMDLWIPTVESLALVLSATFFALLIGIPVGIAAARSETVHNITRPILDFMQTMPAFVYLIPAVIFFGLGKVPGAMATLIFAMPPAVRLTSLGIRQVPEEVVEAGQAFGATPRQLLFKAQLPIAMITILAGVNQTIMLALSMVVIGGMIGAGGLGEVVLSGITQLKLGLGFEGGIAVVILAIYLDRVTQALGSPKSETNT